MRFLLDHDVPDDIAYTPEALGHPVLRLRDLVQATAADDRVWRLAAEHKCVLITCNRDDFLALAAGSGYVSLTKAGQLAMREVLDAYLRRLRHGKTGLAVSLSPILPWAPDRQDYVIDPAIAYGRPVIAKHGVPVEVVANRINGGETIDTLARDYGLHQDEIKTALAYARAA